MTDLTNLTAKGLEKQFLDRIMVSVRNPEWREICRRLEELEQLKLNYAASESLRQQVNDDRTKELIIYQKLRERLEQCEAALREGLAVMCPDCYEKLLGTFRAAVEEK